MGNIKQAIDNLNPEQRQAVEQVYGPVLVLAGPGTGKTQLLTARIAHILQAGVGARPENILCLTFTETATTQMRERLGGWIGQEAYGVKISTFHGFCQWVIDEWPRVFTDLVRNRQVADDLDKALAYQAVIADKAWPNFKPVWDEMGKHRDFLTAISQLKREGLNPDELQKRIPAEKERRLADPDNFYKVSRGDFQKGDFKPQARVKIDHQIAQMTELAELWEAYESALVARGLFDFDDLVNWVGAALADNEGLRLDLQERFQWILVDEYQDTNDAQNQILWELTRDIESPNVFAVGDPKQSIYRFQGASEANVADFRERFPARTEINLTANYRSHQAVLDQSYQVIGHNGLSEIEGQTLRAAKASSDLKANEPVRAVSLPSRAAESAWLAAEIKTALTAGVPPNELVVLARSHRELQELAESLGHFGLELQAPRSQDIRQELAVRQLRLLVECVLYPNRNTSLFELLHADFLGFDLLRLRHLPSTLSREEPWLDQLAKRDEEPWSEFVKWLLEMQRYRSHLSGPVLLTRLVYESGLAAFLAEGKRLDQWQAVTTLLSWSRGLMRVDQNLNLTQLWERWGLHDRLHIPIQAEALPSNGGKVQLMTVHKSKGTEFSRVFLTGLTEKNWEKKRAPNSLPLPRIKAQEFDEKQIELEETRRLVFVAMTRAKDQLSLSYATTGDQDREQSPSRFWHELQDVEDQTPLEVKMADIPSKNPLDWQQEDQEILAEKLKNFRWSASSLQTYLDCPQQFLYQYIYDFPRLNAAPMALGNALHQTLERAFVARKKGSIWSQGEFLAAFEASLSQQNFESDDWEKMLFQGKKILETYCGQAWQSWDVDHAFGVELEVDFRPLAPEVEGIRLTGKIDKVVFCDAAKQPVKLVDYKSGKPSLSLAKGGRYWRQLVFYDLLVRQSVGKNWQPTAWELEFLTPNNQGQLETKSLQVTAQDRERVIAELKAADAAVRAGEFRFIDPREVTDQNLKERIEYWQGFREKNL